MEALKKPSASKCTFLLLAALFRACAQNQDQEIITDRPDPSPFLVPKGTLQIENGLTWTQESGRSTMDGPLSLMRLGLGETTEVRIGVPDYYLGIGKHETGSGFGDLLLGMKQRLVHTEGGFDLAIIPAVSLPTGSLARSSGSVDPALQAPFTAQITDSWLLGVDLGFSYVTEDELRRVVFGSEAYVDRQIGKRLEAFAGYAGESPRRGSPTHVFEFGGAYTITPNQQIDSFVGVGLSRAAPDVFASVGYSVRFGGILFKRSRRRF